MRARPPWTGWSRSRSAASPSPPPRPPRSGRASASTSSTRLAMSTSPSRWSARCACSTARYACSTPTRAWSRRPRPCGGRATSTKSRASCSATRWTRSARITSSASHDITTRLGAKPVAIQLPIGAESGFKGVIDLVRMVGVVWDEETLGAQYHDIEIPADLLAQSKEYREHMIEAAVELDDDAMTAYLEGRRAGRGDAQAADPQGGGHRRLLSGAVRLGVQEQGRAAAARRRGRLSAVPDRGAADQGHRSQGQRGGAQSFRQGAARHARLQDHGRPVCRHHHLLPHLFGHACERERRHQLDPRAQGTHRPHAADARQQPRGHQGGLCGRHRRARRAQGGAHRRHPVRPAEAGHSRKDGVSRPRHRDRDRAEVESRPGEARRRAREACGRGPLVPRLHRSRVRPDHPQGHGRAASRHQGRHPQAQLQGRRQYRPAAGGLSRKDHQAGHGRLCAQEADRRFGPVRGREDRGRAEGAGHGLRVREQGDRRHGAEGIHPGRREGP